MPRFDWTPIQGPLFQLYRIGSTIHFEALNKRRAGRVIGTGPRRIKVRYVYNTGSVFERYLAVDEKHLTPEEMNQRQEEFFKKFAAPSST